MSYIKFLETALVVLEGSDPRYVILTCNIIDDLPGEWSRHYREKAKRWIRKVLVSHPDYRGRCRSYYCGLFRQEVGRGPQDEELKQFQIYMLKRMIGEQKCKN